MIDSNPGQKLGDYPDRTDCCTVRINVYNLSSCMCVTNRTSLVRGLRCGRGGRWGFLCFCFPSRLQFSTPHRCGDSVVLSNYSSALHSTASSLHYRSIEQTPLKVSLALCVHFNAPPFRSLSLSLTHKRNQNSSR